MYRYLLKYFLYGSGSYSFYMVPPLFIWFLLFLYGSYSFYMVPPLFYGSSSFYMVPPLFIWFRFLLFLYGSYSFYMVPVPPLFSLQFVSRLFYSIFSLPTRAIRFSQMRKYFDVVIVSTLNTVDASPLYH